LAIIEDYLPKQLSDDEALEIVKQAIADTGASTKRDMGKVMGKVMPAFKGRYDGSKVKDLVLGQLD
ncbi:MAG: GatB/YqeY domain-containing protein, partial [Myxococcota bacterium]|nr:GatB/YqeY domain-containing protein [Myxococcota bacterium]